MECPKARCIFFPLPFFFFLLLLFIRCDPGVSPRVTHWDCSAHGNWLANPERSTPRLCRHCKPPSSVRAEASPPSRSPWWISHQRLIKMKAHVCVRGRETDRHTYTHLTFINDHVMSLKMRGSVNYVLWGCPWWRAQEPMWKGAHVSWGLASGCDTFHPGCPSGRFSAPPLHQTQSRLWLVFNSTIRTWVKFEGRAP